MEKITKKAFTMAEVLMVLAVLGIIAAILIPSIASMKPDQNRIMFKKAYYLTERLIAEIVNDEELYTSGSDSTQIGFVQSAVAQTIGSNGSPINVRVSDRGTPTDAAGSQKLCLLFMDRLNLISDNTGTTGCGSTNTFTANGNPPNPPTFKTVDGVWWYFPVGTWTSQEWKTVLIDTNGDKKPNCQCGTTSCPAGCKKPDRFAIRVRSDGKMEVQNFKEKEYLRAASTMSDK